MGECFVHVAEASFHNGGSAEELRLIGGIGADIAPEHLPMGLEAGEAEMVGDVQKEMKIGPKEGVDDHDGISGPPIGPDYAGVFIPKRYSARFHDLDSGKDERRVPSADRQINRASLPHGRRQKPTG